MGLAFEATPAQALLYELPNSLLRDCVSKRALFTPSTDPTPPPPTALLLFIQRAQLALVYQERVEVEVATAPTPKHAA
jgi:hypothetical protein